MAHDHNEKIHTCKPCGYWHVAAHRFQIVECPQCESILSAYCSRKWAIENIDGKFENIPDKGLQLGMDGFV